MDGASFEVQYERLNIYLKHNKKPKYIIQEVSPGTTFSLAEELPHYQQFLPYIDDEDMWIMVKHHYPTTNFMDRYFPLYKYNNELQLVKEGVDCYSGKIQKSAKYKGYQGMNKSWDASFYQFKKNHPNGITFKADSAAVALFNTYLDFCKQNDIQVILVNPPSYFEARNYITNYIETQTLIAEISTKNKVPLINYENDSICYDRTLFYNTQHMNKTGAELFTQKLASDLRKDLMISKH